MNQQTEPVATATIAGIIAKLVVGAIVTFAVAKFGPSSTPVLAEYSPLITAGVASLISAGLARGVRAKVWSPAAVAGLLDRDDPMAAIVEDDPDDLVASLPDVPPTHEGLDQDDDVPGKGGRHSSA